MPRKSESTDFQTLAYQLISRRGFTEVGLAFGASAFFTGTAGPGGALTASRLGFKQVAANSLDTITVPKGYSWHVVSSWGDPLGSEGAELNHESRGSGASQERAFGHNNNGMALFRTDDRTILAVNNEYVNLAIFYGNRASKQPKIWTICPKPRRRTVYPISRSNSRTAPVRSSRTRPTTGASQQTPQWRSRDRRAGARIARPCSSAFSILGRRVAVISPAAAARNRAPASWQSPRMVAALSVRFNFRKPGPARPRY